ncbi:MAG: tyrosine-type recombinase/integrase [Oscillospiraceae bacterium]|nr:tyrosine-type recombinase/integrase [Oscillospiraceae bacterium]
MDESGEIKRLKAIIAKQQELINLLMGGNSLANADTVTLASQSAQRWSEIEFKNYLKSKSLSENTIASYVSGVKVFFDKYGAMNENTVRQYNDWLIETFKPQTINLRLAGLNHYFQFADVEYSVRWVKEEKRYCMDNIINDEQYERLVAYTRERLPRTYVICTVLAHTGMRVSEFCSIRKSDFLKGEAHIVSKANRARPVYFTKELIQDVSGFLSPDFEYLVPNSRTGEPVTTRTVSAMLKHAARMAGVDPAVVYPHAFRHYFAKKFLEKTNDISLLADILGHGNIKTTAIYTRKSKSEQIKLLNDAVNW